MTDESDPQEDSGDQARRRRRLAEIFGDVLPDQTAADAEEDAADRIADEKVREAWLKRQVPPHHG
jgi:hypothetical protein